MQGSDARIGQVIRATLALAWADLAGAALDKRLCEASLATIEQQALERIEFALALAMQGPSPGSDARNIVEEELAQFFAQAGELRRGQRRVEH